MPVTDRTPLSSVLPDFPWDTLAQVKDTAANHPDGIVDLSVGTPVDAVDPGIQLALSEAAPEPGYPPTAGTAELKEAIVGALQRRYRMAGLTTESVLPVVGTKEAIALLPTLLGIRGQKVIIPTVAYPTYEVAALLAGCTPVRSDEPVDDAALAFINSPSNPTGAVASAELLGVWRDFARDTGCIVASDECYLGLGWDDEKQPISLLDEDVAGGDNKNLIAVHSLSKTSNLASYRAGYLAGDEALIAELTEARKHTGLMVPGPIQHAMVAALDGDLHEELQKSTYALRRAKLLKAVTAAGLRVEHSEAGLYLWATRGESGRDTVAWLAEHGILAAPGDFYGPDSANYVRIALTATDERIDEACRRLHNLAE
ncbi:succinyldiaminopimelate transaminase [Corynebacterium pilosum]|uniref:N-succinyldiaminopimelate aminotransferase n=1 Tax=Corynebacterium pilosum TaxID=35756 RepID=A0A376CP95_9CORY|nr:succinyldiaminopimelate transaminase [Corynebacterium pilosum]STC70143.1 N-succinyldiaminopimelate aminotransferase [Corynebacterium pilosum]